MGVGVNAAGLAEEMLGDLLVELIHAQGVGARQKPEACFPDAVMHGPLFPAHGAVAVAELRKIGLDFKRDRAAMATAMKSLHYSFLS